MSLRTFFRAPEESPAMLREPSTCVSLLERLRRQPTDQQAWREFVGRYAPTIHAWCRHWHLQEADAEDVTQSVLIILARRMKTFDYDPSGRFRAWLQTVTRNAWSAFVESRRTRSLLTGDDSGIHHILANLEAPADLVRRLDECFDRELLDLAMEQVRVRVEPHTWEAFRLTTIDQVAANAVADQVGMKVATVYVAVSKVKKMIRAEVRRLEGEEPDGEDTP